MAEIRVCTKADLEQLREISMQTFDETFRAQNTKENMDTYLQQAFTIEKLTKEMENPHSQFYFIYEEGLAGYLKLNTSSAQTEKMGQGTLEIERIYIKNDYQRRGLGEFALEKAIAEARQQQKKSIWLGVWEKNEQALQFYRKHDFKQMGTHTFFMGDEAQVDLILEKRI